MSLVAFGWVVVGVVAALVGRALSVAAFPVALVAGIVGSVAGEAIAVGLQDTTASGLLGAAAGALVVLLLLDAIREIGRGRTS